MEVHQNKEGFMETKDPQTQEALDLYQSTRGRLVIQKAIYYGLQKMIEQPEEFREDSDIADIVLLRQFHPAFCSFPDIMLDQDQAREYFNSHREVLTGR